MVAKKENVTMFDYEKNSLICEINRSPSGVWKFTSKKVVISYTQSAINILQVMTRNIKIIRRKVDEEPVRTTEVKEGGVGGKGGSKQVPYW